MTPDLERPVQALLDTLLVVEGAARAALFLSDEERPPQDWARVQRPGAWLPEMAWLERVARTGEVWVSDDPAPPGSLVLRPVRGEVGDVLGVLAVGYPSGATPTPRVLDAFATQAAVLVEQASQQGEARRINEVIEIARQLTQDALRPDVDLRAFLDSVMAQTLKLLDFETGWLMLCEGERVRVVATDAQHRADRERVFPLNHCVSGASILRKQPINLPDLSRMPPDLREIYKAPLHAAPMQSELAVPLLVGEEAIGAFNIESQRRDAFQPRDVELLRLLSGHVALAVELARLRDEAAALTSVGLALAQETEMDTAVRAILEHALRLVQGQFGQVLIREGQTLVVRYTTNQPPRDVGVTVEVDNSISGLAVRERRPVLVPDVTKAAYWLYVSPTSREAGEPAGVMQARTMARPYYQRALEREKERIRAEIALPLFAGAGVVGVLNVETAQDGFSAVQRHALERFATDHAARFAEALALEERDTLLLLLQEALALADTSFGQILRLDGDELVIVQTTGGEPLGTQVPLVGSVTGRAVRQRVVQVVPQVADDPDYQRYLGEEIKSEMVVPLIRGPEVIGVLNMESSIPGFFTSHHARVLEAFAAQAATAIDRAQRIQKQIEDRRLAAIGGLSGDIVHRLNNPLGLIRTRIEWLKELGVYPEMIVAYPQAERFVQILEKNVGHAIEIIQELRAALKEGSDLEPRPLPLLPAVQQALEQAALPATIAVQVALPDTLPPVQASPKLPYLFWNLLDNARKAMPSGGTLTITGAAADGWVTVTVADTGRGIEPWRLASIFEPGETTTQGDYGPAHGLGLWWTKSQLEQVGGRIEVESERGAGTCFTLWLRAAPAPA